MKVMSMVPDDETLTFKHSTEQTNNNYLNLETSTIITLSDGSTLNANDTSFNLRRKSILHGRGNYVASLRFLYTVARNLVNNTYSGTRIQKIQSAINASLDSTDIANDTFYGENKTYCEPVFTWTKVEDHDKGYQFIADIKPAKVFTSLEQRLLLEKAIYLVANTWFEGQNDSFNELLNSGDYSNVVSSKSFEIKTALKIIGIATHLCGDLYAHKTVVPINTTFAATAVASPRDNTTIYKGSNGLDFDGNGRWSATHGIKTLISSGSTITTQQINIWKKDGSTTGYADSIYFYNERLTTASKQLVANMYDNFFDGATLGHMGFFVNWFLHTNYALKLANLKLYTYSIGSQPTMSDRLSRLNALDSTVAISDVVPADGYTIPDDAVNTWNKGYVPSY